MSPDFAPLDLSVVIPVKNEEASIAALVVETHLALAEADIRHEIIVVDDGSADQTVAHLEELADGGRFPLRVLVLEKNVGQSHAMRAGCLAARAPWIGCLDGDGQNDPADFPKLLRETRNFDVVCGVRAQRSDTGWRKVCSRVANRTRNWATRETIDDVGCSIRVFRRECVEYFPPYRGMHRFLPTLFRMAGFTVTQVPVNHRAREHGLTKYSAMGRLREALPDLFAVRWMQRRVRLPRVTREITARQHGPVKVEEQR